MAEQPSGAQSTAMDLVTACILGVIIFYRDGGRLFVIAGRQLFLVPPLGMRKRFWSPLGMRKKNVLVPPWPMQKKILVPPLVKEHPLT